MNKLQKVGVAGLAALSLLTAQSAVAWADSAMLQAGDRVGSDEGTSNALEGTPLYLLIGLGLVAIIAGVAVATTGSHHSSHPASP